MPQDDTLITLSKLRQHLKIYLRADILKHLAQFLEITANAADDGSLIERYQWFCNNSENGPDCRYAAMAKDFFLRDQAKGVAKTINWLYHNFSKRYE